MLAALRMTGRSAAAPLCAVLASALAVAATTSVGAAQRRPNVVVILVDDLGYADIGPFGGETPTPNLDRMAKQGRRFTDFVASSAVCSASRAAILTGCYHERVGIRGALMPDAKIGLHDDERTIAELCRQRGFATACFGKWHLGHQPRFLPLRHGFDEYFGLPYSNDMWPLHPTVADLPKATAERKRGHPPLPLIEGERVVDAEVTADDQQNLTRWFTERAVDFIRRHAGKPFFLYVPHAMVHVPLFASAAFAGKSGHGLYADVLAEVDWSVGAILDALHAHDLDDDTLVVFTSDNGPWLAYGNHAGSAGPLREGKGTMWEGGYRVPTLMRWPGRIPAGTTCDELAATIDLLPTIAHLIEGELPDHAIDGRDIRPLMFGEPGATSPHASFACWYGSGELRAVRDRQWKLVFPHEYAALEEPGGKDGRPAPYTTRRCGLELYDLKVDPGETTDVGAHHPAVVQRLQQLAAAARTELGDSLQRRQGKGRRVAGRWQDGDAELRW